MFYHYSQSFAKCAGKGYIRDGEKVTSTSAKFVIVLLCHSSECGPFNVSSLILGLLLDVSFSVVTHRYHTVARERQHSTGGHFVLSIIFEIFQGRKRLCCATSKINTV